MQNMSTYLHKYLPEPEKIVIIIYVHNGIRLMDKEYD